ncbi:malectin domain-containing carbohydrate-binding protein [Hymenobacter caeli]|nr:malectin domain-containing carbohydrate-binding protein [Hymenobacter caeli]
MALFTVLPIFGQTKIQFILKQEATTSAGAYTSDGTLVRTLWRGVSYSEGPHTATWDGKDDQGQALPAGPYEVRVLSHNINYVWDGAIGNTSAAQSGTSVFQGFLPIRGMVANDTAIFYTQGYNEGQPYLHRFRHTNPRSKTNLGRVDAFTSVSLIASDGTNLYLADNEGGVGAGNKTSFVYARRLKDDTELTFTAGQEVRLNGSWPGQYYPSVIDLDQTSPPSPGLLQNGATGLAVQRTGRILAVAHRGQNVIRLFDKTTGQLLANLPAASPGSLSMTPAGDLWAVVANGVVRYTNLSTLPLVAAVLPGLAHPLAVGTDPANEDLVLVADGGPSQQVKAYSRIGVPLWTYGQAGGYVANGSAVRNDKLWFENSVTSETAFITVLPDHSFWVSDIGNNRCLHFSATRAYLEQVMYQPFSYTTSVDANDPTRVFSDFLEFKVDYTKPIGDSWTLVRNWRAGLDARYIGFTQGLHQVATLANGRTYALLRNFSDFYTETAELGGNYLRPTGIRLATVEEEPTLMPDGTVYLAPHSVGTNTAVAWHVRALTGFDGSGNPQWALPKTLASVQAGPQDPVPHPIGGIDATRAPVTSSGVMVSFDNSKSSGWHLGGIRVGSTKWLWKASPTGALDGKGSFDIGNSVQYPGNAVMASGRHVLYGYHGEGWNYAEACQHMHFYDDGLFIGQFGESNLGHLAAEGAVAGSAGNGLSPCLTTVNGEMYLWVNDEGGHGPQRWHLVGAGTVQEATGTGALGATITLVAPAAAFPQRVMATPGNQQIQLTWQAAAGATGYTIRYASAPGGPYITTATHDTATTYTVPKLANDTRYYLSVVPQLVSGTGPASAEATAVPYALSSLVQLAGNQSTNSNVFTVNSTAPGSNQPAVQLQPVLHYEDGTSALSQVGSQGYVLYNWGGPNIDNANVRPPFTVTKGSGWRNDDFLSFQFNVDALAGNNFGLYSNPTGQINIGVADDKWHYLTACCPSRFADARRFVVTLAPQGQPGAAVRYAVSESYGRSHIFQFRFKGPVTLTVDSQGGSAGTLQAIFLDGDPLAVSVAPVGQLAGFTLVNADKGQEIKTLHAGETLNLAILPTRNLNIRANTSPAAVGSVALELSGKQTKALIANTAPYALFGTANGRYNAWTPATGSYALKATPFAAGNGSGPAGTALTAPFAIIDQAVAKAVYRINAGGSRLITALGVFAADTSFWPAPGIAALVATPIANTGSGELYQSQRQGTNGVLNYSLPVPNGKYTVILHFAENTWAAAGKRVFDVALEDHKMLAGYDIYKKVGAAAATTETLDVAVADGTLNVNFSALASSGGVDQPTVAAIEVLAAAAPLPVTLAAFGAERRGPDALLTWATASEQANAYFEVESSTDGTTFDSLGKVAGYGTTSQAQHYQFTDLALARYKANVVYYRLRQVDTDGTETLSQVRPVQATQPVDFEVAAWPNPLASGEPLSLRISTTAGGAASLLVTDAVGRTLSQQQVALGQGSTTFVLAESAQWPKGLYVLHVQQAGRGQSVKVVRK